jgi:hypothetical protein
LNGGTITREFRGRGAYILIGLWFNKHVSSKYYQDICMIRGRRYLGLTRRSSPDKRLAPESLYRALAHQFILTVWPVIAPPDVIFSCWFVNDKFVVWLGSMFQYSYHWPCEKFELHTKKTLLLYASAGRFHKLCANTNHIFQAIITFRAAAWLSAGVCNIQYIVITNLCSLRS